MRIVFLFLLFVSVDSFGQLKNYIISVKGDTLNRVDLKGKKQGPWFVHVDDLRGERGYEEEGFFQDDLKEGVWKRYSLQGIKIAEENYRWGKLNGRQKYFTYNGGLLREETWRAMDPSNPYDTVDIYDVNDHTKIIKRVPIKNDGVSLKHGEWNYYDPAEGVIVKTENYQLNKLVDNQNEVVVDDDLKPIDVRTGKAASDTVGKKASSKPQAVLEYEKKNSNKKKIKSRDGSTGY